MPRLRRIRLRRDPSVLRRAASSRASRAAAVLLVLLAGLGATGSAPLATAAGSFSGAVTGTVFQDFNANGVRDSALRLGRAVDAGIAGIEVRAFDRTGALVGTATTGAAGSYTLSVTGADTADVRVEFSIPVTPALRGLQPAPSTATTGASGSTRGTTIQFASIGNTSVDLGLFRPGEYCQDDPTLVTCGYFRGVGTTTNVGAFTLPGAMNGFTDQNAVATRIGSSLDLGSVFGIGIDRMRNVYLGTHLKRHVEYGLGGPTNSIYRINLDAPDEVSVFLTLPGELPAHDPTPAGTLPAYSADTGVFRFVGRVGLGDVDVTPDGRTLLAVDVDETAPKLYFVPLVGAGDAVTPGAYAVTAIPRPDAVGVTRPSAFDAIACPGIWHPMGLGVRGDRILVGGVCGAEDTVTPTLPNGPHLTRSTAFVLEYEEVVPGARDGSGTFRVIWGDSLGYERGCVYTEGTRIPCSFSTSRVGSIATADWGAWNEYPVLRAIDGPTGGLFASNPQAMLANIEILDTGGLVLGFRDRYQDQVMAGNAAWSQAYVDAYPDPPLAYPRTTGSMAGGDLRRVCATADGLRTEVNGTCPTGDLPGGAHLDASGQREYFEDAYTQWGSPPNHPETATGGLASQPGFPGMWSTAYDVTRLGSQGVYANGPAAARLGTAYRGSATGYGSQIGGRDFGNLNGFNKGIGLADLEVICDTPPIEIGDRVWRDLDGDGVQDAGEAGIAGVTVRLYDAVGNLVATRVTDANGQYRFTSADGLQPGEPYEIRFDEPADYAPGGPLADNLLSPSGSVDPPTTDPDAIDSDAALSGSGTFGVTTFPSIAVAPLAPGESVQTYDAGFVRPVAMGDVVWIDVDGDGRQDAGEPGLAGVLVELLRPVRDADGVITGYEPVVDLLGRPATARTDDLGRYVIDDLLPGEYVARFTLPDGYAYTTPTADGVGGASDSDAVPTEADPRIGLTAPFTISTTPSGDTIATSSYPGGDDLRAGLIDPTIDAGVVPLGTIAGVLWRDEDRDGLRDEGEAPIAPQEVVLRDASGAIVATTTSAADGSYAFTGVPPGTYTVETATPSGLAPTIAGAGSPLNDSSTSPATVTLAYGSMVQGDVDLGFVDLAITGTVWFDADQDGDVASGERLLGGVTVELLASDGTTVLGTTTTADDGSYRFDGLDEGAYQVRFTPPDGMVAATGTLLTAPVTLTSQVGVVDAGLYAPRVSVGDLVWFDADADGVQDGGEPGIPGVLLGLEVWDGTGWVAAVDVYGAPVAPLITDEDGRYLFIDLPFGSYRVTVLDPPDGMVPTTPGVGGDPSVDSSTGSAESGPLTMDGASDRTLDFGFTTPPPVISGMVWRDEDGDASIDGSERGIAGLTVELYGPLVDEDGQPILDGEGDPVIGLVATTETDAAGRFLFTADDGLRLGEEYTVVLAGSLADHVPSTGTTITTSPNDTEVVFGLQPTVSVGDLVWFDVDRDGRQDEGEPGIAGVTVNLYDADGTLRATTTTDPDGRYLFTGLPYGVYTTEVVPPDGFVPTLTGVGEREGDSSYTTATSALLDSPGAEDLSLDFGFWRPEVSVGDVVWLDLDRDGIQDDDEPGIDGVVLRLEIWDGSAWIRAVDVFGAQVADATTDQDGSYLFDRLPLGTYRVTVVTPPSGLEPTVAGAGLDREVDSSTGSAVSLPLLVDGASDMTLDFGFIVPRVSVGDLVWFDSDGDGIQDDGEPGISGVTLTLFVQDGVDGDGAPVWVPAVDVFGDAVLPTVTDATGTYRFDDLSLGTYRVVVTPPPGFTATLPGEGDDAALDSATDAAVSVPLTADGQHDPTLDFGFTAPSVRVGNLVWFDEDGDGLQGPGEPGIAGVTLTVTTADGGPVLDVLGRPVTTTVTDEDGRYLFDLLPPGQYRVTVTPPPGFFATTAGAGDDRGLDSSTGTATSAVLAGGEEDLTLDSGFITGAQVLAASASLGGTIWMDLDEDQVRREDPEPIVEDEGDEGEEEGDDPAPEPDPAPPGEPRIGELTVRLVDLDGNRVTDVFGNLVEDQVTSSLGEYRFDALPLGQYRVVVVSAPSGTRPTLAHGTVLEVSLDAPGHLPDVDFAFVPVPPVVAFLAALAELLPIPRLIPAGLDPSRDVPLAIGAVLLLVGVVVVRRRRRARAAERGGTPAPPLFPPPSAAPTPLVRPEVVPPLFGGDPWSDLRTSLAPRTVQDPDQDRDPDQDPDAESALPSASEVEPPPLPAPEPLPLPAPEQPSPVSDDGPSATTDAPRPAPARPVPARPVPAMPGTAAWAVAAGAVALLVVRRLRRGR